MTDRRREDQSFDGFAVGYLSVFPEGKVLDVGLTALVWQRPAEVGGEPP